MPTFSFQRVQVFRRKLRIFMPHAPHSTRRSVLEKLIQALALRDLTLPAPDARAKPHSTLNSKQTAARFAGRRSR